MIESLLKLLLKRLKKNDLIKFEWSLKKGESKKNINDGVLNKKGIRKKCSRSKKRMRQERLKKIEFEKNKEDSSK